MTAHAGELSAAGSDNSALGNRHSAIDAAEAFARDVIEGVARCKLTGSQADVRGIIRTVFKKHHGLQAPAPAAVPATLSPFGDKRVIPPLPQWVTAYSASIGYPMDGDKWCDQYAVKGWVVGKAKMKDWQCAVRNWKANRWGAGSVTIDAAPQAKANNYRKF